MGRNKEEFRILIPSSLREYLAVDTGRVAANYKAAHLISILTNHVITNYPDGGYFLKKPLTSNYLSYLYTDRYYKQVILPLREQGIIQVNDSYSNDLGYCKEYALSDSLREEVIDEQLYSCTITKGTLIEKIKRWQRGTLARQMKIYPFVEREAEMLIHLNIDTVVLQQLYEQRLRDIRTSVKSKKLAVTNSLKGKEEILQLLEAQDLLDARVRYISGRVYHPLVNCPREFRLAVVDDVNQPYVEIDLRSSQAVFLCKVIAVALKQRFFTLRLNQPALAVDNLIDCIVPLLDEPVDVFEEDGIPADFRAFVSAVFLDDIYEDASPENLAQTASKELLEDIEHTGSYSRVSGMKNLIGEEREKAKKKFFKEIFFNYFRKENDEFNENKSVSSAYLDSFYKSYPTVAEFCRTCAAQSNEKKKKSRDLALLLQQTESKFFHEMVATAIKKDFNYFIVHDAIYVPEEFKDYVLEVCSVQSQQFFGAIPLFR
jgi:hypothetical protein